MKADPTLFCPHRFIDVDLVTKKMHLRETFLSRDTSVRSFYVCALPDCPVEAVNTAKAMSRAVGIHYKAEDIDDALVAEVDDYLEDAQMEKTLLYCADNEEYAAMRDAQITAELAKFPIGVFSFGTYKGWTIDTVIKRDPAYVEYRVDAMWDDPTLFQLLLETKWHLHNADGGYVGKPGERLTVNNAEAVERVTREGLHWTQDLIHVIDCGYKHYLIDDIDIDLGTFSFKATVVEHTKWEGIPVTLLDNVVVL